MKYIHSTHNTSCCMQPTLTGALLPWWAALSVFVCCLFPPFDVWQGSRNSVGTARGLMQDSYLSVCVELAVKRYSLQQSEFVCSIEVFRTQYDRTVVGGVVLSIALPTMCGSVVSNNTTACSNNCNSNNSNNINYSPQYITNLTTR